MPVAVEHLPVTPLERQQSSVTVDQAMALLKREKNCMWVLLSNLEGRLCGKIIKPKVFRKNSLVYGLPAYQLAKIQRYKCCR